MRKSFLLIALTCLAFTSFAQEPRSVSLNVYGGYTFTDRVRFDASYADVKGAFEWGGGLEYFTMRDNSIELRYRRMSTNSPLYGPGGNQLNKDNDQSSAQFILAGGNHYFSDGMNDRMIPYVGAGVGVAILSGPENSKTTFAWDMQAGVKIRTQKALAFKLHAYLQSAISQFGNDYWYYPGWGTVAVADYAHLFQIGLGGAVVLDFRKK
jgi:opacity protein-like surface antigen